MSRHLKSPRRRGRETAFQVLYGSLFWPRDAQQAANLTLSHFMSIGQFSDKQANEFAHDLIFGVLKHTGQIDRFIQDHSQNWRLQRIAKVELTILRLAVFEMLYQQDVPPKVAINEGIELSKKFGDPQSSRFVNGILDGIAKKQIRPEDTSSNSKNTSV